MLPRIVATIFQHKRQIILPGRDFEWSDKSWTHNVFRFLETVFGRKYGVRVEMVSWNDGITSRQVAYSFEAHVALFETYIRELFAARLPKLEIVRVPVLSFAGGISTPALFPYSFAIAFDASSAGDGGTNTATPASTTHTCTGSNLVLATGIWNQGTVGQTPNSVTYNAVSLGTNKVTQTDGSLYNVFLYGLSGPSTGANSLTWTYASSAIRNGNCNVSMTGCAGTFGGTSGATTASGTSVSSAVTTTQDNSWVVSFVNQNAQASATTVTGTNQTYRTGVTTVGGLQIDISTQTTTTAGSYTDGWSMGATGTMNMVNMEVQAPAGAATTVVKPLFTLMGVGAQ